MFPNCPSKKIDVLEEAGPMPDERFADEHADPKYFLHKKSVTYNRLLCVTESVSCL